MRGIPAAAILVLAATVAAAETSLDELWIPDGELRAGWDALAESPVDPAADPDLVRWGVRARETRHYTRHRGGFSEVCSVEVWAFASEPLAESAHANFAYPNWEITREGSLLLMLRGRAWQRGEAPAYGAFDSCRRIGDRIRERAARLLRRGALSQPALGSDAE